MGSYYISTEYRVVDNSFPQCQAEPAVVVGLVVVYPERRTVEIQFSVRHYVNAAVHYQLGVCDGNVAYYYKIGWNDHYRTGRRIRIDQIEVAECFGIRTFVVDRPDIDGVFAGGKVERVDLELP